MTSYLQVNAQVNTLLKTIGTDLLMVFRLKNRKAQKDMPQMLQSDVICKLHRGEIVTEEMKSKENLVRLF